MRRSSAITLAVILGGLISWPSIGIAQVGLPATVAPWAGTPQSTLVNSRFQITLAAVVRDANANGVQGVTVTFTAPASGASASFGGSAMANAVTDNTGAAIAPALTANGQSGSFTLTASVPGIATQATFSLTNTGGGGGTPLPPMKLTILGSPASGLLSVHAATGTLQTVTVNTAFATLQASVLDSSNNPVAGEAVTFTASAGGASASFSGASSAIAITGANGLASAPTLTANGVPGSYLVSASVAGVAAPATFTLTNASGSGGTGPGVWTNVTPASLSLDPNGSNRPGGNNYGVEGVQADLSRPGTLYATATYQGMWQSTDYGLTWTQIIPTSGPYPPAYGGSNFRVAPDGSYIIATAQYPINAYSNGAWITTNQGQTWTRYNVGASNGDDIGHFEIDPMNPLHVFAATHSAPFDLFESIDGGHTWTNQGLIGSASEPDVSYIDSNTLLAISDGDNGSGNGTFRGVRSGSTWPWSWTWTYVSNQQHWHGVSQVFVDNVTAAIFTGGGFGIQKSTDGGQTWATESPSYSGVILGTPNTLYSSASYASLAGFTPSLMTSSRTTSGTIWTSQSNPTAMTNGAFMGTVVSNAGSFVLVTGNWLAGIWRYVEP